jgi:methylglutaconyl-CoA hydratase
VKTLQLNDAGGIRTVTMNRPERRNALNPEMQDELIAAFEGAARAGARVVVLQGAGEAFCSGLDLSVLETMKDKSAEEFRADAARTARMFAAVWQCDVPTIAKVHRAAMAGGAGLVILCDFTIASTEAVFGFSEAKIGFVPALVGAYLPLLVGEKIAREMLLSARRYSAMEALRSGLVNEVVEPDQLDVRVAELAKDLLGNSPQSLMATKRMLRQNAEEKLRPALHLAAEANAAARETEDFREGIASFLEKRKPRWTSE